MNWPFNNKPKVKQNIVPREKQKDFEREEEKIKQFEKINKKFYKDVERYVETINSVHGSEHKLIKNLISITTPSTTNATDDNNTDIDDFNAKLNQWKDIHLGENLQSKYKLEHTCKNEIIEPVKKLNEIFPNVHTAIKRREQAYLELDKQKQKYDKLMAKERTGDNLVKLNNFKPIFEQAKEAFEKENSYLMENLPKLYESRLNYIYPCIQHLVKAQIEFYEQITGIYASLVDDVMSTSNKNEQQTSNSSNSISRRNSGVGQAARLTTSSSSASSNMSTHDSSNVSRSNSIFLPVYDSNIDVDIEKCFADIKSLSIVSGN